MPLVVWGRVRVPFDVGTVSVNEILALLEHQHGRALIRADQTNVDVESSCRATWNQVPLSGFLSDVRNAPVPPRVTPGMPIVELPIQSVLKNCGDERMNIACRFTSSNLSVSARFSLIADP